MAFNFHQAEVEINSIAHGPKQQVFHVPDYENDEARSERDTKRGVLRIAEARNAGSKL